eukprot:3079447-Pleurochrysis_carterae.AAC.1
MGQNLEHAPELLLMMSYCELQRTAIRAYSILEASLDAFKLRRAGAKRNFFSCRQQAIDLLVRVVGGKLRPDDLF